MSGGKSVSLIDSVESHRFESHGFSRHRHMRQTEPSRVFGTGCIASMSCDADAQFCGFALPHMHLEPPSSSQDSRRPIRSHATLKTVASRAIPCPSIHNKGWNYMKGILLLSCRCGDGNVDAFHLRISISRRLSTNLLAIDGLFGGRGGGGHLRGYPLFTYYIYDEQKLILLTIVT
jgi:hypothetical protein